MFNPLQTEGNKDYPSHPANLIDGLMCSLFFIGCKKLSVPYPEGEYVCKVFLPVFFFFFFF